MKFRIVMKALAVALLGIVVADTAAAQAFPTKQVTIVVPYAPGATDQLARVLAGSMEKTLGKPVVVETRPGAGGSVGAAYVAKSAAPDGHAILFAVSSVQTVAPHQNPLPYGFDDLVPLARITTGPNVVAARADAPFKDLKSLIAYAKANPEKVTFGSSGTGGATHLAGEAMARMAGIKLTHIPFPGVTPAVAATIGGNVDLVLGYAQAMYPHVQAGKLVPIAQFAPTRTKVVADLTTLKEGGVDLAMVPNVGAWVAKGTPAAALGALEKAIETATKTPEFVELCKKTLTEIDFAGSAAFQKELVAENAFYKKLLTDLGMAK